MSELAAHAIESQTSNHPTVGCLPVVRPPTALRATRGERIVAALVAAGILTVLIVAAGLRADPRGMGTHKQLGLPTCGWVAAAGVPCPTCGMTTAFAAVATGHPVVGVVAQPMGALLALAGAAGFWGALHVLIFSSRLGTVAVRALQPRILWCIGAAWAGSWMYKLIVVRTSGE